MPPLTHHHLFSCKIGPHIAVGKICQISSSRVSDRYCNTRNIGWSCAAATANILLKFYFICAKLWGSFAKISMYPPCISVNGIFEYKEWVIIFKYIIITFWAANLTLFLIVAQWNPFHTWLEHLEVNLVGSSLTFDILIRIKDYKICLYIFVKYLGFCATEED